MRDGHQRKCRASQSVVELAADSKVQHLLAKGRSPPHLRTTGAGGQLVKPRGLHSAGLDTTKPFDGVDVGHDAGADEVAQKSQNFIELCFHYFIMQLIFRIMNFFNLYNRSHNN